jgi:hypothetical protein
VRGSKKEQKKTDRVCDEEAEDASENQSTKVN